LGLNNFVVRGGTGRLHIGCKVEGSHLWLGGGRGWAGLSRKDPAKDWERLHSCFVN